MRHAGPWFFWTNRFGCSHRNLNRVAHWRGYRCPWWWCLWCGHNRRSSTSVRATFRWYIVDRRQHPINAMAADGRACSAYVWANDFNVVEKETPPAAVVNVKEVFRFRTWNRGTWWDMSKVIKQQRWWNWMAKQKLRNRISQDVGFWQDSVVGHQESDIPKNFIIKRRHFDEGDKSEVICFCHFLNSNIKIMGFWSSVCSCCRWDKSQEEKQQHGHVGCFLEPWWRDLCPFSDDLKFALWRECILVSGL